MSHDHLVAPMGDLLYSTVIESYIQLSSIVFIVGPSRNRVNLDLVTYYISQRVLTHQRFHSAEDRGRCSDQVPSTRSGCGGFACLERTTQRPQATRITK